MLQRDKLMSNQVANINQQALVTHLPDLDAQKSFIMQLIADQPQRMEALYRARELCLMDWCIAAGFVRNLVWDFLHHKTTLTPLNDIDLIYCNALNLNPEKDVVLEDCLIETTGKPWSVKNQAYMHLRNNDNAYVSTADALTYWVEVETMIGVTLEDDDSLRLIAPLGVQSLLAGEVNINPTRPKRDEYYRRMTEKNWLDIWPNLDIKGL